MKGKLRYLTISMFLLLILTPFLEKGNLQRIVSNILLSAILIFGVYVVSYSRNNIFIAVILGLPWFIFSWISLLIPVPIFISAFNSILLILFFIFTAKVIFIFILKSSRVNKDVLYGAVSVYMLIGGIFWIIFSLIEVLQPGSFSGIANWYQAGAADLVKTDPPWTDLLYYSYSTLTTLGYGDIIPKTSVARTFAILEAIFGVMYLAIIISRLVGLYITQSKKE